MVKTRPSEGIATDGAHSTKNSQTRYRAVDIKTGEQLFYEDIGNQTINIGEFLAVVEAAKFIIEHNFEPKAIYTDSMTAIAWFKAKKTASKKNNVQVKCAEVFLKVMAVKVDEIQVLHWNNSVWGETPADFGNK